MPVAHSELTFSQRANYFVGNLFLRGLIGGLKLIPYRWRVPAMGWTLRKVAPSPGFTSGCAATFIIHVRT